MSSRMAAEIGFVDLTGITVDGVYHVSFWYVITAGSWEAMLVQELLSRVIVF